MLFIAAFRLSALAAIGAIILIVLINYCNMKTLATGTYQSEHDYFTIVIDKALKEIFALKNFSCLSSERLWIVEHFKIGFIEADIRFYHISGLTTIDENLIPKKYKKFTILN